mgnify:FL=1
MAIVLKKITRPIRPHIGAGKKSQGSQLPQYNAKLPPCIDTCPSSEPIRTYLTLIAQSEEYGRSHEESMEMAWNALTELNPIPSIMGRVCPHPCEGGCNRKDKDSPVNINKMELAIGEFGLDKKLALKKLTNDSTGKKVAVIGSGPAGISCAYQLARRGHSVTVFESKSEEGGMLRWGIPAYRLPRDLIKAEYKRIYNIGVEIKFNTYIGKDITLDQLKSDYDAVFSGIGAQEGWTLGLDNENQENVYSGVEFLYKHNTGELGELGDKVVIVGGGDTAMDAARTCKRLGIDTTVVYRRSRNEMPAIEEDIVGAEEEGVTFAFLTTPTELIVKDGKVTGMKLVKMKLGEKDDSGRASFSVIEGSDYEMEITCLIPAISQSADFAGIEELKDEKGWTTTSNDFGRVTADGNIWSGGDVTRKLGLVTEAVGDGRLAALEMDAFLNGVEYAPEAKLPLILSEKMHLMHYPPLERNEIGHGDANERLTHFNEFILPFDKDAIMAEAKRCMSCGLCYDCENCYSLCGESAVNKLAKGEHFSFNYDKCIGCAKCMEECPCGLIDMV